MNVNWTQAEVETLRDTIRQQQAEIERLQAALEAIRDYGRYAFVLEPGYNPVPDLQNDLADMKDIARRALESEAE